MQLRRQMCMNFNISASKIGKYPWHTQKGSERVDGPLRSINSPQYALQAQTLVVFRLFL